MRLLLASKSETRRRMLDAAGVAFEVADTQFDEEAAKAGFEAAGFDARGVAEMLAQMKAKGVTAAPGVFVLGADQTLELESGEMLNKPRSREDLAEQLRRLSGCHHWLHSAAALLADGEVAWSHVETVRLEMRPLSDAFVTSYVEAEYDEVRWSVGGYRIEGLGAQLFERVEGSHFAVLGLPLLPLLAQLRERGILTS